MNILVLTSVFPRLESSSQKEDATKVVYYFAKEWKEQGHNVKVIHNAHRYPYIVHSLPEGIKEKFKAKFGFPIPDKDITEEKYYEYDGIDVWRIPILKMIPHSDHPAYQIEKQSGKIQDILNKEDFVPDVIVGHWMSPQAQLLKSLKSRYHCKTALVLHGTTYLNSIKFDYNKYRDGIDVLGCRSVTESDYVKEALREEKNPFICYSGIPENYICDFEKIRRKYDQEDVWKFVYVGRLVQYKNIDKIIIALAKLKGLNFTLDIIGEGDSKNYLQKLCTLHNMEDKVTFRGKMSREETQKLVQQSQCFIMISEAEVFGLVYLEAMAAGCITIGSYKGGIDGVIQNGINGFLCKSGDADGLANRIEEIINLDKDEKLEIVQNALNTAKDFTDNKVAELYLKNVMGTN